MSPIQLAFVLLILSRTTGSPLSTDGLEFVDKKDFPLMRIESQIVQPVARHSYSSSVTKCLHNPLFIYRQPSSTDNRSAVSRSPQFKFRYTKNSWLIWGSQSGQFEGYRLIGHETVQIVSGNVILNIRRDMELDATKYVFENCVRF